MAAAADPPEAQQKPSRALLYAALVFLAFWVGYLTFFGPKRPARLEHSGMSEPAAYDWTARPGRSRSFLRSVQGQADLLELLGDVVPSLRQGDAVDRQARP